MFWLLVGLASCMVLDALTACYRAGTGPVYVKEITRAQNIVAAIFAVGAAVGFVYMAFNWV